MALYHIRNAKGLVTRTVDGEVFTARVLGRTYNFGVHDHTITELSSGWRVCDVSPGRSPQEALRARLICSPTGFIAAVRKAVDLQRLPVLLPPLPVILPPLPPLPKLP